MRSENQTNFGGSLGGSLGDNLAQQSLSRYRPMRLYCIGFENTDECDYVAAPSPQDAAKPYECTADYRGRIIEIVEVAGNITIQY